MSFESSKRSLANASVRDIEAYKKYIKKLTTIVGREVVEYLNKFRALENPEDITAWKLFCENHPSKELRDWYAHKVSYPWLLPGYNSTLSRMPSTFWSTTPSDSNLVESAHVETNRNTGIGLTPVEAIEKAREFDSRVAASVLAASKTCIPRNINNSEIARMSRNLGRQRHLAERRHTHVKLDNQISDLKSRLDNSTQITKDLKAQLKDLAEQKKEAGKTPRHCQAPSNRFNISIPKIQGRQVEITTPPKESAASNFLPQINFETRNSAPNDPDLDFNVHFANFEGPNSALDHSSGMIDAPEQQTVSSTATVAMAANIFPQPEGTTLENDSTMLQKTLPGMNPRSMAHSITPIPPHSHGFQFYDGESSYFSQDSSYPSAAETELAFANFSAKFGSFEDYAASKTSNSESSQIPQY